MGAAVTDSGCCCCFWYQTLSALHDIYQIETDSQMDPQEFTQSRAHQSTHLCCPADPTSLPPGPSVTQTSSQD